MPEQLPVSFIAGHSLTSSLSTWVQPEERVKIQRHMVDKAGIDIALIDS